MMMMQQLYVGSSHYIIKPSSITIVRQLGCYNSPPLNKNLAPRFLGKRKQHKERRRTNEGDPHVPKLMNNGMVRPLHLAKLARLVASLAFCLRNNGLEELKDCRETRRIGWA